MTVALAPLTSTESKRQRLEYLKSADRLYKEAKSSNFVAMTEVQIGTYYRDAGDNKAALTYLEQAQAVGGQAHTQAAGDAALQIGIVYVGTKDYQKATEFERKAVAIYHEFGNKPQEAMALEFVAEDLQLQGKLDGRSKPASPQQLCRESPELFLPSIKLTERWQTFTTNSASLKKLRQL